MHSIHQSTILSIIKIQFTTLNLTHFVQQYKSNRLNFNIHKILPLKMIDHSLLKQQDSANYIMYERIKIESRVTRHTLNESDSYKESLARQYFQLANAHYKKKQYQNSINFYESALKYNYQSHQIHNNLGVMHALLKHMDEAVKNFNKSIQIKLTQVFAYINLANIYIKFGYFSKGFQLYLNLLIQNKQQRILDHFNKVIKSYNVFYKFLRKNLISCHKKIDPSTLQSILKDILKDIDKNDTITDSFKSTQNIITEAQVAPLKYTCDQIMAKYSDLHWCKNHSNLSHSILYSQQFEQCLKSIMNNKNAFNVLNLLLAYIFIQKDENEISYYFYSKINKSQTKSIKQTYYNLYQNYQKFKKNSVWSYAKQTETGQIQKISHQQNKLIIISIDHFFFHEYLPMYYLHDLSHQQSRFKQNDPQIIQSLANMLKTLQNYKDATCFYFNKYRQIKNKDRHQNLQDSQDYLFEASLLELRPKQKTIIYQSFLQKMQTKFDQGNCTTNQLIKLAQYQSIIYFTNKQYSQAIQVCEEAIRNFKNKNHRFHQCKGSIYFAMGRKYYKLAQQSFLQAIKYSKDNQEAHFQLYCLLYSICKYQQEIQINKIQTIKNMQIQQSKKNQIANQFNNETFPLMFLQDKKIALSYLTTAIKIKPSQLRFYLQLAFFHDEEQKLQQNIVDLIDFLSESYTRLTDFKIQSNIAIFHLLIGKYDASYYYFKVCLKEASKENDTDNCQDVRLLYFVNKIYWIQHLYTQQEHKCNVELSLYLIIFINASFLFTKYQYQSHLFGQDELQNISNNLNQNIERKFAFIIERINKFEQEHKEIICPYIFRTVLKDNYLRFSLYQQLIQECPFAQKCFWSYQLANQIKQKHIQYFQEFFTFIQQKQPKQQKQWMQHFKEKTCLFTLNQVIKKNQIQCNQLTSLMIKNFLKIKNLSNQIKDSFKHLYNSIKCLMKNAINFIYKKINTMNLNKLAIISRAKILLIQVIITVSKDFQNQFKRNDVLESQFIKISQALLRNQDLHSFFQKLKNYFQGDYLSQNSSITFFNSDISQKQNLTLQYLQDKCEIMDILGSSMQGKLKVIKCMKELIIQAQSQSSNSLLKIANQVLVQIDSVDFKKVLFNLRLLCDKKIKFTNFINKLNCFTKQVDKYQKYTFNEQESLSNDSFEKQSNIMPF